MAEHKGAGQRPKGGVTGGMRANMAARDAHEAVIRKRIQEQVAARMKAMSQGRPLGTEEDPKSAGKPGPKPKGD